MKMTIDERIEQPTTSKNNKRAHAILQELEDLYAQEQTIERRRDVLEDELATLDKREYDEFIFEQVIQQWEEEIEGRKQSQT
jgi:hypothetical protein